MRVGDELVWSSASTNLKRGDADDSAREDWAFEDPPITAWWTLRTTSGAATPASRATTTRSTCTAGRRSRSASRARSPTACGEGPLPVVTRLPDAFTAEVRFKKPILLPSKVKFGEAEDRFAVLGHLEGVSSE